MFQLLFRLRLTLLILLIVLVPLAWWLRFHAPLDGRWRDWTGGAAYVLFWSMTVLIVRPRLSPGRVTAIVLLVTCALEFLQLWHPYWLESIRRTLPGRLILGTTFDWGDFRSYFAGALLSFLLLRALTRINQDQMTGATHLRNVDVHYPKG